MSEKEIAATALEVFDNNAKGKDGLFDSNSAPQIITKKFKRTVEAFFDSFDSELTATEYRRAAEEFFYLVGPDLQSIRDLNRDHIIFYRSWLKKKGLAKKTRLKKLSAISSLCKHLAHEGYVARDITYGVKRPKCENKKETADFKDADVKRIFAALDPVKITYTSHRAILAIGFYTGLRSTEIRNLTVGSLMELDGHRILRLKIKGDKTHEVPLTPFAYRCISEHIDKLGKLGFDTKNPGQWLFPALKPIKRNRPIAAQSLREILHNRLKDAGITLSKARRYSPHSMRATVASHLLNEKEVPLEEVQVLLGHSSPTTTQRYNKRAKSLDKNPVYKIEY